MGDEYARAGKGIKRVGQRALREAGADLAAVVCRRAAGAAFVAAGACSTNATETAIANSVGTFGYFASTQARMQAVVYGETSSGYSERVAADFAALNAEEVAEEA